MNQFLKKINEYRQRVGESVKHLTALELKCDRHFDTEIMHLNETFKAIQREIQLCYSKIYKKLESDVTQNKQEIQKSREVSTEILGDLLKTKQDVEDNYEKIVLKMDIDPFSEIMNHYSSKMKTIETNLKDLSMYECDLAQLEENKDFMNQTRMGLRNLFSIRNIRKAKHKKFNSEEVMFESEPSTSPAERKEIADKLRQSQESPRNLGSLDKGFLAKNFMNTRESGSGIDAKIHQQFRRMTAELISDKIGTDKVLENEARELISKIDQVVFDSKRSDHVRTISNKEAPSVQIKNVQLSKSESSHLRKNNERDQTSTQKDEYGSLQKVSFTNRRLLSNTSRKDAKQPTNLKLSTANSMASSKNEDSSKGAEQGATTPVHQSEKLGKFLKKHFTQSDLKRFTASKTSEKEAPQGKSKLRPEAQRSDSKNPDKQYHVKATLTQPHSAKKTERKETANSKSDYFSHLLEMKLSTGFQNTSPDIHPAKAPAKSADVKQSTMKRSTSGQINQTQGGRAIINITKNISPKVLKDNSPSRPQLTAQRANPAHQNSSERHLEAAESVLQRIVSLPRNNFVIPKFMKKQPSEAFKRMSSAKAGAEFVVSRSEK